jgi:hypothetical protein
MAPDSFEDDRVYQAVGGKPILEPGRRQPEFQSFTCEIGYSSGLFLYRLVGRKWPDLRPGTACARRHFGVLRR